MKTTHSKIPGFSLVELAIVLVILGLLVGGVLAGKSLIRASELRAITTQYNEIMSVTNSFKDKYFAIPGDMPNATQFWGQIAVGAACRTTPSTDTRTCDGNNNGNLKRDLMDANSFYEGWRYWQHLANAGLMAGSYSGISGSDGPKGKLSKSFWRANDYSNFASGSYTLGEHGTGFHFSARMLPEEVWAIDNKMDDGNPIKGKVIVYDSAGAIPGLSVCADNVTSTTYLLTSNDPSCSPLFIPGGAQP